jgi:hypothetical protein
MKLTQINGLKATKTTDKKSDYPQGADKYN